MKQLTFKDVVAMFNALVKKGYTIQEIMTMPIFVGEK